MINALAHDLADVGGVEAVWDLDRFGAELLEFFVERVQARADALVFLEILAAS
jgi:hypothetical protein